MRQAVFVTFAFSCAAAAALAEPFPTGTYRGTVGDEPISVCLGGERPQFYRDKVGKTVELEELPRAGAFLESDPSHPRFAQDFEAADGGWWEFRDGRGTQISGVRHVEKEVVQPITLTRVAEDCAAAYEEHRLGLPVTAGERTSQNGVVLEKGTQPVTGVGALRVVSGIPEGAAAAINTWLEKARRELDSQWVDCSDWEGSISTAFVSRVWIVFDLNDSGFCGGIHPNEASTPRAFDARDGSAIDFSQWIDSGYWSYSTGVQGKLRDLLVKTMKVDAPDCAEHRLEAGFGAFTPWLGPDGFAFRLDETARYFAACDGDYVVPFGTMRPFIDPSRLADYDRFVAAARKLVPPSVPSSPSPR
ncbi:MAG TPA: hypothetical protein VFE68_12130 [Vicinamibacteria bacterium]|nr:hypothetical protein [Vicinamibacteria bacterium]